MSASCTLEKAIDVVTEAVKKDENKNYEEALSLYEEGIKLLHSLEHEEHSENSMEIIRNKSSKCVERAEKLKEYLQGQQRKPVIGGTGDSNYNDKDPKAEKKTPCLLNTGIDIVRKAVEEDENRNYEEALRLYEEGIKCFLNCLEHEEHGGSAKEKIRSKSSKYLERAEKIKEYLWKQQQNTSIDSQSNSNNNSKDLKADKRTLCSLNMGIDVVRKAVVEDENGNYEEALRLYEEGVQFFHCSIKYETDSERAKESIRNKSLEYEERAKILKDYLREEQENKSENRKTCSIL